MNKPRRAVANTSGPTPAVSVVMPAFNVAAYVREAVASVLAQTFRDFELIAVNDGSADQTGTILDELASAQTTISGVLRVIHQPNQGVAAARNAGIAAASGDLIAFLDGDDRWMSTLLERAIGVFESDSTADLVFPWYRHVDARGDDTGSRGRTALRRFELDDLFLRNPIHSCTGVVVRRVAIDEAGGFDEQLGANVDFDLWLRVSALRAGNVVSIPEILADYRTRPGQLTESWHRMSENWERVLSKCRTFAPEIVQKLERPARANQCLYWSMLARRRGDYGSARRLIARAWSTSLPTMLRSKNAWISSLTILCSVLPVSTRQRIARWTRTN